MGFGKEDVKNREGGGGDGGRDDESVRRWNGDDEDGQEW